MAALATVWCFTEIVCKLLSWKATKTACEATANALALGLALSGLAIQKALFV